MGILDRLRQQPAWTHDDPKVRREAIAEIQDPAVLSDLLRTDPDERVREEAADSLLDLTLEAEDEAGALAALAGLSETRHLVAVARSAPHEGAGRAALARLTDKRAVASVARNGAHDAIRLEALGRLDDPDEICDVALKSAHKEVALAALERVATFEEGRTASPLRDLLSAISHRARSRAAVHRARAILREREQDADGSPDRNATDRERQIALCESLEALSLAEGMKRLAARISSLQDAWTDLLPDVDEDLERRFETAYEAARRHLAANQLDLAEQRRLDREREEIHARHIAPRQALIDKVMAAEEERAPVLLADARWEWERLEPHDSTEANETQARFDQACQECERKHAAWSEARTAAQAETDRTREREKRERREQENAERLTQLCDAMDKILQAKKMSLRHADRGLRQVRSALDAIGPLPSRRDQRALMDRLKAIHASLSPRVREMRDSEAWRLWANTNVQEKLCAAAEVSNPAAATRRLSDLQARWRTASTATQERGQDLWNRFKAAADLVRIRVDAHRAVEAKRKEALCEQAEALADSTDWIKTADALKRLQSEWKTIGTAGRGPDKALWERFRQVCDRFFSRRKEDLARRKQEWRKNLEAKQGLCEKAELLADSTDWAKSADAIRALQMEWKGIGPVGKVKSDATWKRFRGACDQFFDRFKRRDEIDCAKHLEEREAICRELESFDAPAETEEMLAALREFRARWQQGPALPRNRLAAIEDRFNAALGQIIRSAPERFSGTDLDPDQNRKRMEDLCGRVEKLIPAEAGAIDRSASPATRLATMWVEALASNTIGGKVALEAKWRTAEEEIKKAQSAWRRIGYVPEETRRHLAARFDKACRIFTEKRPPAPRADAPPRQSRGPRGQHGRDRPPRKGDRPESRPGRSGR